MCGSPEEFRRETRAEARDLFVSAYAALKGRSFTGSNSLCLKNLKKIVDK